ncbi:kinase-like domain-containing protein [Mycena galopus ATCC 62051]|nr:kinase-like domain-containing protein [Mycena galopus ATCC 62051]
MLDFGSSRKDDFNCLSLPVCSTSSAPVTTSILTNWWNPATGTFSTVTRQPFVLRTPPGVTFRQNCRLDTTRLWIYPNLRATAQARISPISGGGTHEAGIFHIVPHDFGSLDSYIGRLTISAGHSMGCEDGQTLETVARPPLIKNHGTRYRICGMLGRGSTSKAMLAMASFPDSAGQDYVAIKTFSILSILRRQRKRKSGTKSKKIIPTARSINTEVRCLQRLSESSNNRGFFTPLLAAFHDNEKVHVVMRMYPENLSDRLSLLERQGLRLAVETIRLYAAELLFALESLHTEHRTLHCDLKPRNILIAPSGHLCLADFGLSIHCFDGPEMRTFMVPKGGTPHYWPPECHDTDATHVNGIGLDTYALGRIFHEMFHGAQATHRLDGRAPEEILSATVSDRSAADLIREMISVNPAHRPPLSHLKNHPFFFRIDWEKFGARGYTPRYRPGPKPRLSNTNLSRTSALSRNSLDAEQLALGAEEFVRKLDFNYKCPESLQFDPLHI